MTKAADIMHPGAQWVPSSLDAGSRAAQLMWESWALPIADEEPSGPCGILTDRDIVVGCVAEGKDCSEDDGGGAGQGHAALDPGLCGRQRCAPGDGAEQDPQAAGDRQEQAAGRHHQRGRSGPPPQRTPDRRVRGEGLRIGPCLTRARNEAATPVAAAALREGGPCGSLGDFLARPEGPQWLRGGGPRRTAGRRSSVASTTPVEGSARR